MDAPIDAPMHPLSGFHPAVRAWFERRFSGGPTEPQAQGWPTIAEGRDTLIAAPTGTGKTLTAFLVCIDRLYREFQGTGFLEDETHLVYVSPLKALGVDIQKNLNGPLQEIREELNDNIRLAQQLGIRGSPAFIIGDEIIPGARSLQEIEASIERARSS